MVLLDQQTPDENVFDYRNILTESLRLRLNTSSLPISFLSSYSDRQIEYLVTASSLHLERSSGLLVNSTIINSLDIYRINSEFTAERPLLLWQSTLSRYIPMKFGYKSMKFGYESMKFGPHKEKENCLLSRPYQPKNPNKRTRIYRSMN